MSDDTGAGASSGANLTAAERREIAKQARQQVPRFTVADLRARPGVMEEDGFTGPDVVMGLAREDDPDKELTRAEVAKLIEAAHARPVEHDDAPTDDDDTPEEG